MATQRYISALCVGRRFKCGFSLFELESVNNSDECHWIWMKFGRRHVHYVCYLPCKYEFNRRGLRFGGNSKVYKCSLSWKSLVTRTDGIEFHSNLVEDMCTMCATCPVKMSSIGGGSRFGGNSKVYKCSLSWK